MRLPKRLETTTLYRPAGQRTGRWHLARTTGNLRDWTLAGLAAMVVLSQPIWGQVPTWPPTPAPPAGAAVPSNNGNGNVSSWDPRFASGNAAIGGESGRSLGNASWAGGQSSPYLNGNAAQTAQNRPGQAAALLSTETAVPNGQAARQPVPLSGYGTVDSDTGKGKEAPAAQESLLRLPRSNTDQSQSRKLDPTAWGPIATTFGALAVVLGIFLIFAWMMKRASGKRAAGLPNELVEILGQVPLNGRQRLCVVRFGRKLVLACVSVDGAETLAELTDPEEVGELLAVWRRTSPASASQAFRKVFAQYAAEEPVHKQVG
ncbi:MAG: FliO/MopB family protein [Thermogutta sp.]